MLDGLLEVAAAEDVGGEPLLSVILLESLAPVERRELEDATRGPARQQAEEIAQVRARLDAVQLAAGEERDEGGVHFGGLVGADEEPVDAALDLAAERVLRDVMPRSGLCRAPRNVCRRGDGAERDGL